MSKNHKNRDERMKEIRRYLDGKMSDTERNSFERKLQKDPFEEEALEGFSSITSTELNTDIKSLRSDLKGRTRKRTPLYYRIAAALVVLLVISSLFLVRELREPEKLVSESLHTSTDLPEVDKTKAVENLDESMPGEPTQTGKAENEKGSDELVIDPTPGKEDNVIFEIVSDDIVIPDSVLPGQEPDVSKVEVGIIEGQELIQAKEKLAVEETKAAAGTRKSREMALPAKAQAQTTGAVAGVSAAESRKVEDEIVIDISEDELDLSSDSEPIPQGGMKEFKKYLETDQIFPEEWTKTDKEIVKIDLTIDNSGKIIDYKIIKSPGIMFSEEATRLINEGPPWKPAIKSGEVVEGSVRIRIIFQR
jgi:hypothetical protein